MTPEQLARQHIDAMLNAAGWAAQNYAVDNPTSSRGFALRQVPLAGGRLRFAHEVTGTETFILQAAFAGRRVGTRAEPACRTSAHAPYSVFAICE